MEIAMTKENFAVDHDRAQIVFGELLRQFEDKAYPFNQAMIPQKLVDISDFSEYEQSMFWFILCYWMRGMVNSNDCAKKLAAFFKRADNKKYLLPETTVDLSVDEFTEFIRLEIVANDPASRAKPWILNSRHLIDYFDGDPRNIYNKGFSYQECADVIVNDPKRGHRSLEGFGGFYSFRDKMAGMITYFLVEQKLIDPFDYIAAVDFHLLRVMLLTGVIVPSDEILARPHFRYEDSGVQDAGREAIAGFTKMGSGQMTKLADALWLLSGNLCTLSSKNSSPERSRVKDLKLEGHKRRKRERQLLEKTAFGDHFFDLLELPTKQPEQITIPGLVTEYWNDEGVLVGFDRKAWKRNQASAIARVCGRCPIYSHCGEKGLPGSDYYRTGRMRLV